MTVHTPASASVDEPHQILVLDDEVGIQRLIRRTLVQAGLGCQVAGTLEEARASLAEIEFALVLVDVNLVGQSGLDLVKEVSHSYPDTAIVMVTAQDDPALAKTAIDQGAYGFIIKPFGINELLINVTNALAHRRLRIENQAHQLHLEATVEERTKELMTSIIQLQRVEARLRSSREETIQRLARAAEFRDDDTGHHIERMSRFSGLLALQCGLDPATAETIRIASPMHDVGKIGIPDNILNKPGRLTESEFAVMKTHTDIGYRILSDSDSELLELAARIAWTHHERLDGTGYPRGISGDDIPIEGRVCAIADVFDALTSKRVYKDAMPVEKAVDILLEGRGTQFDGGLVDLFVESMDEVLSIRRRYSDVTRSGRYPRALGGGTAPTDTDRPSA